LFLTNSWSELSSNLKGTSVFLLVVCMEPLSHTILWTKDVIHFQVCSVTNLIIGHHILVINFEKNWVHYITNIDFHSKIPFRELTCIGLDWSFSGVTVVNNLAIWIHSSKCFSVSCDLCFFYVKNELTAGCHLFQIKIYYI